MDWKLVALIPLIAWALYSVFGSLASNAHGEKVTTCLYVLCELVVVTIWLAITGVEDFKKVTRISMAQGLIMGLAAVIGLVTQLYAFRIAPNDKQGVVSMLGGMFPVLAVVLFFFMFKFKFAGGTPMSLHQWLGVTCTVLGLWLVSK